MQKFALYLFLSLPFIYFFMHGFYGFSSTDHGFIHGLSWRILNGQIPYLDFVYVRPPLSPYLHYLELKLLPENSAIFMSRLIFYLFMAVITFCSSAVIFKAQNKIHFWFFCCIGFLFSVHNYPPMAWHTVDGLLMSSLGLYVLAKSKNYATVGLSGVLFLLASMAKQPFYLVPFIAIVYSFFEKTRAQTLFLAVFQLAVIVGAFSTTFFIQPELLKQFFEQTTGSTTFADLFTAGIFPYLKSLIFILAPLGLFIMVLKRILEKDKIEKANILLVWMLPLVFLLYTAFLTWHNKAYVSPQKGWVHAVFCFSFFYLWYETKKKGIVNWGWLSFLGIAWCSGISWGYHYPILCYAPLLYGIWKTSESLFNTKSTPILLLCYLVVLFLLFGVLYEFPYRDSEAKSHSHSLSTAFSKLNHIQGGSKRLAELEELKRLHFQFGDEFIVLPAEPLAHYLTHISPTVPFDWAHNAEINAGKFQNGWKEWLDNYSGFIFLHREEMKTTTHDGKYGSEIAYLVKDNWVLVEKRDVYSVYKRREDQ